MFLLLLLLLHMQICSSTHHFGAPGRAVPGKVWSRASWGCKSGGEAGQSKSRQSCCFSGTLQAPVSQKGLPAPSSSQTEGNRKNTPTFPEITETFTLRPPGGKSVKYSISSLNLLLQMKVSYFFNIFMCLQNEWVKCYKATGNFVFNYFYLTMSKNGIWPFH